MITECGKTDLQAFVEPTVTRPPVVQTFHLIQDQFIHSSFYMHSVNLYKQVLSKSYMWEHIYLLDMCSITKKFNVLLFRTQ